MLQVIQQNPVIALVLVLVPVVAATWKIFEALYLKPRDFKIAMLEKHIEQLSKRPPEPEPKRESVPPPVAVPASTPSVPPAQTLAPPEAAMDDPLHTLESCYAVWKKDGQTKLQVEHFEKTHTGRSVSWDAFVDSINKNSYQIFLYADSQPKDYRECTVCARFPLTEETRLLEFKPKDRIRLTGTIKEFFIYPVLEPVQIHKA